jgi:hypothetical protein
MGMLVWPGRVAESAGTILPTTGIGSDSNGHVTLMIGRLSIAPLDLILAGSLTESFVSACSRFVETLLRPPSM